MAFARNVAFYHHGLSKFLRRTLSARCFAYVSALRQAFIRRRVLGEGGLQLQRTLFKPPGDQRRLVAPTTVPRAEGLSEVVLQVRILTSSVY